MAQGVLQAGEVSLHDLANVGVNDHGAGSFVLAEFGQYPAGDGYERAVGHFFQSGHNGLFMNGVQEGKEERHRDAINVGVFQ